MAKDIPEIVQRLAYPFKGMDLAAPLSRMPRGSAVLIKNVMPMAGRTGQTDQNMLRRIGGKRPGLVRSAVTFAVNPDDTNAIGGVYLWNPGGSSTQRMIATSDLLTLIYDGAWSQGAAVLTSLGHSVRHLLPTFAPMGNQLFIASTTGRSVLTSAGGGVPSGAVWAPGGVFPSTDANICCRYINRIFAASGTALPSGSVFAASKLGDGNNFDASGSTYEFAYAGNATGGAGQPGDRITGLFSLTDDYMAFGCDSSLWVLFGDPRAGGRVRMASDVTGIAGPRAGCFDDQGDFWFIGNQGLYKWRPGGIPKEVLKGRMAPYLEDVLRPQASWNRGFWSISFDRRRRCLYFFNANTQQQDNSYFHYVIGYAIDYDCPFLLEFHGVGSHLPPATSGNAYRPHCVECFDDGTVLVGGIGGLNNLDDAANAASDLPFLRSSSTAVAIDCLVKFPPFLPDGGRGEWCLNELQATGAKGCGALTYYLMSGRSADEVVEKNYLTDYAATGTLFSADDGFQAPIGTRITDAVHQLIVAQNSSAADMRLDSFDLVCEPMGRRRYGV